MMDRSSNACTHFGLTINISKTKVMYTGAAGKTFVDADSYVDGRRIYLIQSNNFYRADSTLFKSALLRNV